MLIDMHIILQDLIRSATILIQITYPLINQLSFYYYQRCIYYWDISSMCVCVGYSDKAVKIISKSIDAQFIVLLWLSHKTPQLLCI